MALNMAMFEQNGQSGYVLKPAVMWDKSHMMYNHFNPWDKEFDGLHATKLTLHVSLNIFCTVVYNRENCIVF
jgi:phosphatidylinositol phospholipase C epsilon